MSYALLFQVSYAPSPMPYVALAVAAGTGAVVYLRYRRHRSEALRLLANKLGLLWLGTMLPSDFPRRLLDDLYTGWAVPRWSSPHNIIGGKVGEDFLLAFDMTVAKGDARYQRTVVARRSPTAKARANFARGYVYRCLGEWHIATLESAILASPRVIEPGTIEKLWEQLR